LTDFKLISSWIVVESALLYKATVPSVVENPKKEKATI
jgi:hypothetical protein